MRPAFRILLILASLLVLGFGIARRLSRRSVGINVGLRLHAPDNGCNAIAVHISNDRSVKINYVRVPVESLVGRLRDIYQLRIDHVLLIRADSDVSFQEVMRIIDLIQGTVPDVHPVLLTPGLEKNEPCIYLDLPRKMANVRAQSALTPSMRRPVGVKTVLSSDLWILTF
jgi:biopolymer transport protein ExbD